MTQWYVWLNYPSPWNKKSLEKVPRKYSKLIEKGYVEAKREMNVDGQGYSSPYLPFRIVYGDPIFRLDNDGTRHYLLRDPNAPNPDITKQFYPFRPFSSSRRQMPSDIDGYSDLDRYPDLDGYLGGKSTELDSEFDDLQFEMDRLELQKENMKKRMERHILKRQVIGKRSSPHDVHHSEHSNRRRKTKGKVRKPQQVYPSVDLSASRRLMSGGTSHVSNLGMHRGHNRKQKRQDVPSGKTLRAPTRRKRLNFDTLEYYHAMVARKQRISKSGDVVGTLQLEIEMVDIGDDGKRSLYQPADCEIVVTTDFEQYSSTDCSTWFNEWERSFDIYSKIAIPIQKIRGNNLRIELVIGGQYKGRIKASMGMLSNSRNEVPHKLQFDHGNCMYVKTAWTLEQ